MTPDEFIRSIDKARPVPVYLFLGPEAWDRERCRKLLLDKVLPGDEKESGFTWYDLDEVDLPAVLDDAQSMSLFANRRVIWASSAEAVLPRRMKAASDDDDDGGEAKEGAAGALAAYLSAPNPDVVLVFDCQRYDFEGDDKAKLQRVEKFYAAVKSRVEFARFSPFQAKKLAESEAKRLGLQIGSAEIDMLVEALGAEASRVVNELEKLALFAGKDRRVTAADITEMVPSARATTIFALVAAVGRGDRTAALDTLDTLVREGEYLPLALTFLATQFRLAFVAKEAGLSNVAQIQSHFTKQGTPMWRSRAEQVQQMASVFSREKLKRALDLIYQADKGLRDARPDDRTIMEQFVLALT